VKRKPKSRRRRRVPVDALAVAGPPTQSLGIREAQADPNPDDPTRKVHSDSVPLAGAVQPSRRDLVMPTAEPVVPDIDDEDDDEDIPQSS
jgi:hypothetical protein